MYYSCSIVFFKKAAFKNFGGVLLKTYFLQNSEENACTGFTF